MTKIVQILMSLLCINLVEPANILVVCPFFGKSHSAFIHPIVEELALRNHSVTMITTNLVKEPPPNLKQIHIKPKTNGLIASPPEFFYEMDSIPTVLQIIIIWNAMLSDTEVDLESAAVQEIIQDDKVHFDLILVEFFFQEAYYAFAHKYKVPIVLLATTTHFTRADIFMGNPSTVAYIGNEFSKNFGDLTLSQRVYNYFITKYQHILYELFFIPKHENMIRKYFKNLQEPIPSISELEKNVSLVLVNTYHSIDAIRPLVPGIVEVAGVHLKSKTNALPQQLLEFVESKDCFVYFSLGSNLRVSAMPKNKMNAIINVLSNLTCNVLLKWEDDEVPPLPKHIMTSKWFPQSDLLAHPNIKVFITQGGMLSFQEAVFRGVPLLGLSTYGDQYLNMAKMEHRGMGISLPYTQLDEEKFSSALHKILSNPEYAKNAKEVSSRFKDRPNSPIETAMFWIEYVMRHKDSKLLKSVLTEMPWYKSTLLDVQVTLLIIVIIFVVVFTKALTMCFKLCKRRNTSDKNKKD